MWLKNNLLSYENMSIINLKNNKMIKKIYTEQDYIEKCKELKMEYVGFHNEHKKGNMIEFICPLHRDKGIQAIDWSHFRIYKKGCPYCTGRYKTTKDIIPLIKNKNVEVLSEYKGNEKPITCKCKNCGHIWTTITKVLTTNGAGCPKCGKEKATKKETKTIDEFKKQLYSINPNIEVIGEYINTHTSIKCRCKVDNHVWYGFPANLLNQSAGCPICNLSNAERKMLNVLKKLNIDYIPQYSINGCKYVHKLRFDAFDTVNNIAFEYNGEQHYMPIDFGGRGMKWAEDQLKIIKNRDKAKIAYCKKNKIPIIIVPYWERNNMESFIKEELNKIGVL